MIINASRYSIIVNLFAYVIGLLLLGLPQFVPLYILYYHSKAPVRAAQLRMELEKLAGEKATAIEPLCEHLREIGADVTVESKEPKPLLSLEGEWWKIDRSYIVGSIRVANRYIDRVELIQFRFDHGGDPPNYVTLYRCDYVVEVKVEDLEHQLKAYSSPKYKRFFSLQVVDFRWVGSDLAQVLNRDTDLKILLYSPDKMALRNKESHPLNASCDVEIKPQKANQCVRIRQLENHTSPLFTFPTAETLCAYDRIAQHIRSIASVRTLAREI